MMNVFDRFTVKKRHFIVKENNMVETLKMIQSAKSEGYYAGGINVGNCGWAEEPDSWFAHVNLTNNQWKSLLEQCKANNYQLVIKENPEDMYFTKVEGSK